MAELGNIVTVPAICHGDVSVCEFGENRPREGGVLLRACSNGVYSCDKLEATNGMAKSR